MRADNKTRRRIARAGSRAPQDVGRRPACSKPEINTCGSRGCRRWGSQQGSAALGPRNRDSPSPPAPQLSRHCLQPRATIVSSAKSGSPASLRGRTARGAVSPEGLSGDGFLFPSRPAHRHHPRCRGRRPPSAPPPLPLPLPSLSPDPCMDLARAAPHRACQLSLAPRLSTAGRQGHTSRGERKQPARTGTAGVVFDQPWNWKLGFQEVKSKYNIVFQTVLLLHPSQSTLYLKLPVHTNCT